MANTYGLNLIFKDHASTPHGRATILVVDDSSPVRTVLRHVLQDAGYEIYEAAGGRAALEIYRHRPIDLMMIDAHMPEWDGVATLQALRAEFPSAATRVIVMTGDPTMLPSELDPADTRGLAHRIVAKPFHPRELLDHVRQELRTH
ncbi:response regulator [Nitrospira sp.]|nr:response regulator [Nitrospira sp.]